MRNKGFTLIELLVVILIIGILLALIVPNFVMFQERARRASVKNNMHVIQTALEAYAVDHMGNYPSEEVFEEEEESMLLCYFPGGDRFGVDDEGEPVFGLLPGCGNPVVINAHTTEGLSVLPTPTAEATATPMVAPTITAQPSPTVTAPVTSTPEAEEEDDRYGCGNAWEGDCDD